jgi:hypothetical protein
MVLLTVRTVSRAFVIVLNGSVTVPGLVSLPLGDT